MINEWLGVWVIAGTLSLAINIWRTLDNRKIGIVPNIGKSSLAFATLCVFLHIALWPIPLVMHHITISRYKKQGRVL